MRSNAAARGTARGAACYQVPCAQPPLEGGVHVRVITPFVRMMLNLSPLAEVAVTV